MITYITAFIFYTLAMVGILLVGFVIYKKTFIGAKTDSKGIIKVIDSYMFAPKKTLYIIKVKNEMFLIASDADRTTFLSKLSDGVEQEGMPESYFKEESVQNVIKEMNSPYRNRNSFKQQFELENEKFENAETDETKRLQKQFMDLYKDDKSSSINVAKKISSKKEVIQKLLKELNDNKSKIGGKY